MREPFSYKQKKCCSTLEKNVFLSSILFPSLFRSDVNFEELARCTDDFNGAMCKAVCVEAVSLSWVWYFAPCLWPLFFYFISGYPHKVSGFIISHTPLPIIFSCTYIQGLQWAHWDKQKGWLIFLPSVYVSHKRVENIVCIRKYLSFVFEWYTSKLLLW